ncbi:MAG: type II secretion system protein GspL [Woeseiaceae bacterium]|nr:type II secretion system protein GspL [Woeseiaceae bacterium]
MTDYLVIRIGADADEPVSWMAVDDNGTRRGNPGFGSLEDAGREVRERPVIVLVPSADALTVTADVPAKGARLLAALPYALEDQFADDVEDLHFAAGDRLDDGSILVSVVASEKLDGWIERLAEAGITADRIIPEDHGLPRTPNTLSMLVADDGIMFNDGAKTAFTIDGIGPADTVAASGVHDDEDDDAEASRHLLVYCEPAIRERYETEWAQLRAELSSVDLKLLPDGVLPRLAVTVAAGNGINLLQGRYGARVDLGRAFRPWRYAAIFLLAFGVIGMIGKAADYYRLSNEETALREQFQAEYRQLRPNDTREVVDPVATVRSLERTIPTAAGGPQVFLPSMQTLAEALRANEAADVEAVSYRAGVATVRLSAPDIPTLDKIVQAVNASSRFTAELQSATNVGDRVQSRIEIREVGA